jgi:hypothetical protein
MQVFLSFVSLKLRDIVFLNRTFVLIVPKFRYRPIFEVEQGGTAETAFDAVDGIIDSRTKFSIFLTASQALVEN